MRISDWSSDVCSSDRRQRSNRVRHIVRAVSERQQGGAGNQRHIEKLVDIGPPVSQGANAGADIGARCGIGCCESQARKNEDFHGARTPDPLQPFQQRSEEHTSELQSLMRISYAVFCLKKKKKKLRNTIPIPETIYIIHKTTKQINDY